MREHWFGRAPVSIRVMDRDLVRVGASFTCGFPAQSSRRGRIKDCRENGLVSLSLSPLDYWVQRLREVVQPTSDSQGERHLSRMCRFQQFLADAVHFEQASQQTEENILWCEQALHMLDNGNARQHLRWKRSPRRCRNVLHGLPKAVCETHR